MSKKLVIIDGNSLINRAYYAMQRPMITKEGLYTQGIYGFLNMLQKIQKDYEPGYISVAFDVKAPTFRHKEFDEYKAGRKKMPMELAMQMPVLKELLEAMNIKIIELEGFEADDIIGTVVRCAEEEGLEPLVVTGDKDALQLATDVAEIMITKKGVSAFEIFNHDSFKEAYGFEPLQFIDYKAIMGDKSDNIPGVPGIGEKGASKLILEYGSLENIYEKIDEVKPKGTQTKLMDNHHLAFMSKRLATINKFVPIEIDFEDFKSQEPDYDKLVEMYKRLEFNSFLKKLAIPGQAVKSQEMVNLELVKIENTKHLEDTISKIQGKRAGLKIFSDNSHTSKPEITGAAICVDGKVYYVDEHLVSEEAFAQGFASGKTGLYGHDLKNEIYNLYALGAEGFEVVDDTAIAEYVIDSSKSSYDLETLANEKLQISLKEEEVCQENQQLDMFAAVSETDRFETDGKFACKWFQAVNAILDMQKTNLQEEGLEKLYREVELPLVEVMAYMEHVGFTLDVQYLKEMGKVLSERERQLEEKITDLAGEEFNIKSPKQLGPILFEKLGLPAGKKTKSGYSTSAEVLEKIKDEHEIVPNILEYRKLTKLNSTYVEGLSGLLAEDGKIHASFNQTVTTTGRISSSNPNMQNIPVREELGRKIRGAFVPESSDYTLVGADYSQIELRVLAHMSGDQALIDAFNNGQDIHRATAARVMGIPEDQITSEERSSAKAVNFGVIYGMSSFGLSSELNISRREAENYIKEYFNKHQAVKDYMDGQVEFCKEHGYVETILGRKRYIKEIKASNFMVRQLGERLAMNTPIQGSAADIIKLAMVKVYHGLEGMKSRLLLQVHDELIIEAHKEELDKVKSILKDSMESAIKLTVELVAEVNQGENWLELK
ncbi:MAG: DNA polymerase I [Eubacterium sp.]|nr:DNA polymerase I [Eubacterium sp.]